MGHSQITAPTCEPLDLAEVKAHLRVDISDDDALIAGLISSARDYVERETHNQLVTAKWKKTHKYLHKRKQLLPTHPTAYVDGIVYLDQAGTTNTMATTVYDVLSDRMPAQIVLGYLQIWPANMRCQENSVIITYTAGYIAPMTVSASADTVTVTNRTYTNGNVVRLSNSGGALPGGLTANRDYYVINASGGTASTFQLSTTANGSAVDITGDGTGLSFVGVLPPDLRRAMLLLISHWYENREGSSVVDMKQLPMGVDACLWHYRIVEFE